MHNKYIVLVWVAVYLGRLNTYSEKNMPCCVSTRFETGWKHVLVHFFLAVSALCESSSRLRQKVALRIYLFILFY